VLLDIVENFDQWRADYFEEWLPHYEKTGELVWLNYPRAHNRISPAGPGIDLAQSRLVLISSAGGYLRDEQEPFDAANDLGDYSIRTFPVDTPLERIAFAHEHYDHTAVTADPQVLLPLQHLKDMAAEGKIGSLAPSVISYSGYQPDISRILSQTIPAILQAAQDQKADGALLIPA
jgi:D-proline reductase (dithiol) PrdB